VPRHPWDPKGAIFECIQTRGKEPLAVFSGSAGKWDPKGPMGALAPKYKNSVKMNADISIHSTNYNSVTPFRRDAEGFVS
jgi:hypothetical protein